MPHVNPSAAIRRRRAKVKRQGEGMSEPAPQETTTPQRRRQASNLHERIAQARARLEKMEAQETERARRLDTRQKIVVGGTVIAEMRSNENFAAMIVRLLQEKVTRKFDQEAIAEWLARGSTG